jgi:hypothetical protein
MKNDEARPSPGAAREEFFPGVGSEAPTESLWLAAGRNRRQLYSNDRAGQGGLKTALYVRKGSAAARAAVSISSTSAASSAAALSCSNACDDGGRAVS